MREAGREWETQKEREDGSWRQRKTENGKNICIDPGKKYTFGEKRQSGNGGGVLCRDEERREREREEENICIDFRAKKDICSTGRKKQVKKVKINGSICIDFLV